MKKLDKMAEICHIPEMGQGPVRDLANRWFQPLTHVSNGSFPRVTAGIGQRGKREMRDKQRFAVAQAMAQSVREAFAPQPQAGGVL